MSERDRDRERLRRWAHPTEKDRAAQEEERQLARASLRAEQAARTSSELRRLNRLLTQELEQERAKTDLLLTVRDAPNKPYVIKPHKRCGQKNPTVTCSLLSDLHAGERVDPRTVNSVNEYNLGITEARLGRYFQSVVRLIRRQSTDCDVRTHVLWLGGDLMCGHIHEDLVEVSELTPSETILWLRPRLRAGIDYLLKHAEIEKLLVPCSYGNHGRSTPKPRVATAAAHSWEWLLYQILQEDYEGDVRVEFLVASGYHLFVDIGGFLVRFHHGDMLRYQGGVGGIHIPLRKAADAWDQTLKARLDVLGHWHTFVDLQYAILNGSLIGHNAYATKIKARFEPPRQAFFAVDLERKRKTGVYPVFVE